MKGLILSGGKGTRLRPITHTSAKQLVPIANKPILFYGIEAIVEAGISDIGIVVGDTHEDIRAAVGDGSQWGVKITYIYQDEPLGLAHAVLISEAYIKDEPFVMYLGDNMIKNGIVEFANEFKTNKPNSQILLVEVENPQQFGVAKVCNGEVKRLIEKPKEPKSNLALVGVYMFDKTIFKAVKQIKPSWRGELEITDAIQFLIENGHTVKSYIIDEWWKDTGKLEDILEANRIVLDSQIERIDGYTDDQSNVSFKVVIETGAKIINSVIRGPAIIGANSEIVNSFIGPFTSIDKNAHIKNSEIEYSIILDNSSIIDINGRIEASLIGKNVEVSKSQKRPIAHRLMLGDSSRVEVV